MELLFVPVGLIFGSRNSPSWWCQLSELRAHAADCLDYSERPTHFEQDLKMPPLPTTGERARFVQAVPDSFNTGIAEPYAARLHNTTFVDDNVTAAVALRMREAIRATTGSAEDTVGNPKDVRRPPVLTDKKWNPEVSHIAEYLGMIFDSRSLCMSWPPEKVDRLRSLCAYWLADTRRPRPPHEIAQLLGLARNAGQIMPLCLFFVLHLQHCLNEAIPCFSDTGGSGEPCACPQRFTATCASSTSWLRKRIVGRDRSVCSSLGNPW